MTFSKTANQIGYPFKLMELPYSKNSMEQYISSEAFDYHHGKHHAAYVNNLNRLLEHKTELQQKSLEDIILTSFNCEGSKAIFNNAAQIWNHNFFGIRYAIIMQLNLKEIFYKKSIKILVAMKILLINFKS